MPRVKIHLPEKWLFETELPVRITDINYGNHLGNDALLAMLQEARVRWLHQFGWTEKLDENTGLIMVDVSIRFKAEAFFGETLAIRLAPGEWSGHGFSIHYLVTKSGTGEEVARAQTGMLFFDYAARRIAGPPAGFREKVGG